MYITDRKNDVVPIVSNTMPTGIKQTEEHSLNLSKTVDVISAEKPTIIPGSVDIKNNFNAIVVVYMDIKQRGVKTYRNTAMMPHILNSSKVSKFLH